METMVLVYRTKRRKKKRRKKWDIVRENKKFIRKVSQPIFLKMLDSEKVGRLVAPVVSTPKV